MLTKPILKDIVAFDRDVGNDPTFYFNVIGGSAFNKINCILTDETRAESRNMTMSSTLSNSFKISNYYFVNGNSYTLKVRTYDNTNYSEWSNMIYFKCYSNPVINIDVTEGQTISTSSNVFSLSYSQAQGELLDYAKISIFKGDTLIDESENLYDNGTNPLILSYLYSGFENNETYKVQGFVRTEEGNEIYTDKISFNVVYGEPIIHTTLKLDSKCNDGYVDIYSNLYIGDGESNPNPMVYISDEDLLGKYNAEAIKCDPVIDMGDNLSGWIRWDDGVVIPTNFVLKYKFTVGTVNNNIIRLYNNSNDWFDVKYVRTLTDDYIEITTSNGVVVNSNTVTHCNSTDIMFLWIKVNNSAYEATLTTLGSDTLTFNWNDEDNNVRWNMTTDLLLLDEDYDDYTVKTPNYVALENEYNNVILGNSICRMLEITSDVQQTYNEDFDDWTNDTCIICDFNQNLRGGNVSAQLSQLDKIKVKRKNQGSENWVTIYEKDIVTEYDMRIDFKDFGVPSNILEKYAIVPVVNGAEGEYLISEITPKWNYIFVSDGEKVFKLYSGVGYGNTSKNKPIGIMNPIGGVYPITIENGVANYYDGMVSGKLMGYNFETTRTLDRNDVVKQSQDFMEFMENGKSKFITDWNGNCWLVKMIDKPSIVYDMFSQNGTVTVSFSWVEQGKYNNEDDLRNNYFI